ncbi:uncharacterized protein LOC108101462 isoform X3 [Drosophila ficusphila]|uniref:uncharacterized protein LOC108101462 isoform X3 n=1 Tax=Drosophila ficusphila TaxID=30025 RepID=UPI0007E72840|nr:uncharacterized protein LOC108101462 isoform X3 [Drosophila ficusphila]
MYKTLMLKPFYYLCAIIINLNLANSTFLFTTNSEYGVILTQVLLSFVCKTVFDFQIFMAISVPIGLPHRNVFLSYNYEFNYYQPEHVYKYPPILMGQDFEDSYLTYPTTGRDANGRNCMNCTDWKIMENSTNLKNSSTEAASREKRALTLMSRSVFYAMLRDKLRRISS